MNDLSWLRDVANRDQQEVENSLAYRNSSIAEVKLRNQLCASLEEGRRGEVFKTFQKMRSEAAEAINIYNGALLSQLMEMKITAKNESEWQLSHYKGSKIHFFCDGIEISATYVVGGKGTTRKYFAFFEGSKLSFDIDQVRVTADEIVEQALRQLVD